MNDRIYDAIEFAIHAHAGQLDKQGVAYIEHVFRVMQSGETESERIVGVLHDVLEDVENLSLEAIRKTVDLTADEGLALLAITRVEGESYPAYIERVAADPLATAVKLHDLRDNMARGRDFPSLTRRYRKALDRLAPAQASLENPTVPGHPRGSEMNDTRTLEQ